MEGAGMHLKKKSSFEMEKYKGRKERKKVIGLT